MRNNLISVWYFLAGLVIATGLSYGYIPQTVEETCREYTIKWESYERDIKNIGEPAPEAMTIGVYDRCINIFGYESAPADDATAPRVLP